MPAFVTDTVCDSVIFAESHPSPKGSASVYVNGEAVIMLEGHTEALPGRVLEQ